MDDNAQVEESNDQRTSAQIDGLGSADGRSEHEASAKDAVGVSGADAVAQKNNDEVADSKEKQEEEDAALARMMAFQEEQEDGIAGAGMDPASQNINGDPAGAAAGGAGDNNIGDINLDPNVAFLGGDNADDDDNEDAPHPNLNNPAAIALRQRQALQNAARLNPHLAHQQWAQNQPYVIRKLYAMLQPSLRYTPLSLLAALFLVHHTLRTRQQFYLAIVYLQSSKLAYILLGNAIIAMAVSTFTIITRIFLDGGLRPNERDTIGENIRWDVTETCIALTIFRSELDVLTAIEFLGLVIMKCLHWSVELRGGHLRMTEEVFVYPDEDEDDNEDAPRALSNQSWYQRIPHIRLSHIRYYALLQILLLLDILAVAHCALSVATHGPSVDILFGFEAAILLVSGLSAMGSYHLHVIDGVMGVFHHLSEGEHHHVPVGGMAEPGPGEQDAADGQPRQEEVVGQDQPQEGAGEDVDQNGADAATATTAERPPATRTKTFAKVLVERLANPWRDRRATLSFAIELQAQAAKFLFYVVFFAIVFTYYGMPINIFREVYVSFQQLRRRLIAFNTYRRLTHNMEKRFESIKDEEELDRLGHTCIICRDQMDLLGGCKKLPGCGHAFHTHCLREWLVQQQTCPTCRADIAANEARRKKNLERERRAAEREAEEAAAREGSVDPASVDAVADAASQAGRTREEEQSTVARPEQQQLNSTSTTSEDAQLPAGWTQHVDKSSGKTYYYNSELGQSSWEKPVEDKATNEALSSDYSVDGASDAATAGSVASSLGPRSKKRPTRISNLQTSPNFPCLYRITFPSGAPVFLPHNSPRLINYDQRVIPAGKLIVCTSMEYWPMPFQEPMLCMPDGYVRARDVERFLTLTNQ